MRFVNYPDPKGLRLLAIKHIKWWMPMITDGWHKLAEEQPEEGQRVLAMSLHERYPMRYGNASLLYLSLNSSPSSGRSYIGSKCLRCRLM